MKQPKLTAAIVALSVLAGPAFAQDVLVDVKPCNFACGLWRNLSGDAQVSAPSPIDNSVMSDERTPDATEGLGTPKSSQLAAHPGSVMVQTPAELALMRKQRAELKRETATTIDERGFPLKPKLARSASREALPPTGKTGLTAPDARSR